MTILHVQVHGLPAPQGSKRPVRLGNGKIGMAESSKAVRPWRDAVKAAAVLAIGGLPPLAGPVRLTVDFYFARPRSHYGTGRNAGITRASAPDYPAGIPDLSKLVRATEDALTEAGAWRDDAQVTDLLAVKRYGAKPGAFVTIETMEA